MENNLLMTGAKPESQGVSDVEVESVMKLLIAYQKARSEGVAPPNPDLEALLGAMQTSIPADLKTDDDIKIPSGATKPGPATTSDEIVPKPFFVVKTKNEKKQKVFINVCGSHKIGVPNCGENTPTQIDQLMSKIENMSANGETLNPDVRFPCSCLDPKTSADKNGNTCVIYDVCYNRTVVENAMSLKSLKLFLIDMALTWLGQKYHTQLDPKFKLPNAKYKGKDIGKHTIRVDPSKGPIITELSEAFVDDSDLEPSFPLLFKDKQGRTLPDENGVHKMEDLSNVHTDDTTILHIDKTANVTASQEASSVSTSSWKNESHDICSDSSTLEPWIPLGILNELNVTPNSQPNLELEKVPKMKHTSIPKPTVTKTKDLSLKGSKETIAEEAVAGSVGNLFEQNLKVPTFDIQYVGRPVVSITIFVTFPFDPVAIVDMTVHTTSTDVFVEAKAYDLLQVPLQFCVLPSGVQVMFSKSERVLTLELPFLPYTKALKRT